MMFSTRKWFTLVELLIVIVLISGWLVIIIQWLQRWLDLLEKTKNEVIAINLAREGMEAVFNVRNTNWLRRSGQQEKCRLSMDSSTCGDRMSSSTYMSISNTDWSWLLTPQTEDPAVASSDVYGICEVDTKRVPCEAGQDPSFYRYVESKWLYLKSVDSNNDISCSSGDDGYGSGSCKDDAAKEFRFCVHVTYDETIDGDVEFCSVLANFVN